jgi:hypothetical protein
MKGLKIDSGIVGEVLLKYDYHIDFIKRCTVRLWVMNILLSIFAFGVVVAIWLTALFLIGADILELIPIVFCVPIPIIGWRITAGYINKLRLNSVILTDKGIGLLNKRNGKTVKEFDSYKTFDYYDFNEPKNEKFTAIYVKTKLAKITIGTFETTEELNAAEEVLSRFLPRGKEREKVVIKREATE